MVYFLLGFLFLVVVLLLLRGFATANTSTLMKVLRWTGVIVAILLTAFLIATGRATWAFVPLALAAIIALARGRSVAAPKPAGTTGASDVETRFLKMSLDHETGAMNGVIKEGAFAGRTLADLEWPERLELYRLMLAEEPESARLMEAYFERIDPDWRTRLGGEPGGDRPPGARSANTGRMSRDEAYHVLGLAPGASPDDIRDAHRRLMAQLHPDKGGTNYLAAKINEARDVLLAG
ncbi:MAG: DnaJ domain-containing protein [Alphaproteobacteria bacterium]